MVKTSFLCICICMMIAATGMTDAVRAQCLVALPAPDCNGTEPPADDGQTIGSSDSKWFYGSPRVFSSLTVNGGTLIVCGDLTVNNFNFNSGVIFVRPGASLTITSGPSVLMEGGCYIYNYGQMTLQRGLAMDNAHVSATQPNIFINAGAASVFNMLFDWLVINNPYSWFVNEGTASMHGIVTDPLSAAGSVCLGSGSQVNMSVLINNAVHTYTAPSGAACVAVSSNAYICEQVTGDGSLNVCMGATHGTDSSCLVSRGKTRPWGNAQLFSNCTNCHAVAILPVQFSDIMVLARGDVNYLHWRMERVDRHARWRVERSTDGVTYGTIAVRIRETGTVGDYECEDERPLSGTSYYRVICEVPSSGVWSSKVVVVKRRPSFLAPGVNPNPFHSAFRIVMPPGERAEDVSLMDAMGIQLMHIGPASSDDILIGAEHLPAGSYLVRIVTAKGVYLQRVIKR